MMGRKYRLVAACLFRDSAFYLREWIEYHLLVGVEKFYMCDHLSSDGAIAILAPYVARGQVVLVHCDRELPTMSGHDFALHFENVLHVPFMRAAVDAARTEADWIMLLDSDEFVVPTRESDTDLRAVLARHENDETAILYVNWQMYGTSGVRRKPTEALLVETLTMRARTVEAINTRVKSIVRPQRFGKMETPHWAEPAPGTGVARFTNGARIAPWQFGPIVLDELRINHYGTGDSDQFEHVKVPFYRRYFRDDDDSGECVSRSERLLHCDVHDPVLARRFGAALRRRVLGPATCVFVHVASDADWRRCRPHLVHLCRAGVPFDLYVAMAGVASAHDAPDRDRWHQIKDALEALRYGCIDAEDTALGSAFTKVGPTGDAVGCNDSTDDSSVCEAEATDHVTRDAPCLDQHIGKGGQRTTMGRRPATVRPVEVLAVDDAWSHAGALLHALARNHRRGRTYDRMLSIVVSRDDKKTDDGGTTRYIHEALDAIAGSPDRVRKCISLLDAQGDQTECGRQIGMVVAPSTGDGFPPVDRHAAVAIAQRLDLDALVPMPNVPDVPAGVFWARYKVIEEQLVAGRTSAVSDTLHFVTHLRDRKHECESGDRYADDGCHTTDSKRHDDTQCALGRLAPEAIMRAGLAIHAIPCPTCSEDGCDGEAMLDALQARNMAAIESERQFAEQLRTHVVHWDAMAGAAVESSLQACKRMMGPSGAALADFMLARTSQCVCGALESLCLSATSSDRPDTTLSQDRCMPSAGKTSTRDMVAHLQGHVLAYGLSHALLAQTRADPTTRAYMIVKQPMPLIEVPYECVGVDTIVDPLFATTIPSAAGIAATDTDTDSDDAVDIVITDVRIGAMWEKTDAECCSALSVHLSCCAHSARRWLIVVVRGDTPSTCPTADGASTRVCARSSRMGARPFGDIEMGTRVVHVVSQIEAFADGSRGRWAVEETCVWSAAGDCAVALSAHRPF